MVGSCGCDVGGCGRVWEIGAGYGTCEDRGYGKGGCEEEG